jgi:hypothetical protein
MSILELETGVRQLSHQDLTAFTRWFDEYASSGWDARFDADAAAGKLQQLGRKADSDFIAGNCTEL